MRRRRIHFRRPATEGPGRCRGPQASGETKATPTTTALARRAGPGHPGSVPTRKGCQARGRPPPRSAAAPAKHGEARREGTGGRFGRKATEVDHGAAVVVGVGQTRATQSVDPRRHWPGEWGVWVQISFHLWWNGIESHGLSEPGQPLPGSTQGLDVRRVEKNPIGYNGGADGGSDGG